MPLADEPLGAPDVYGGDRLFAYLRLDGAHDAAVAAVEAAGFHRGALPARRPRRHRRADDHLGARHRLLRRACCGINPFDQPNVAGRQGLLVRGAGRLRQDRRRWSRSPPATCPRRSRGAERGRSFLVIQAYVTPTADNEAALQEVRRQLRDALARRDPDGLRPALPALHGPAAQGRLAAGIYLQVLAGSSSDAAIPGRAYGFRTVIEAQSRGDAQALRGDGPARGPRRSRRRRRDGARRAREPRDGSEPAARRVPHAPRARLVRRRHLRRPRRPGRPQAGAGALQPLPAPPAAGRLRR